MMSIRKRCYLLWRCVNNKIKFGTPWFSAGDLAEEAKGWLAGLNFVFICNYASLLSKSSVRYNITDCHCEDKGVYFCGEVWELVSNKNFTHVWCYNYYIRLFMPKTAKVYEVPIHY